MLPRTSRKVSQKDHTSLGRERRRGERVKGWVGGRVGEGGEEKEEKRENQTISRNFVNFESNLELEFQKLQGKEKKFKILVPQRI